MPPPECTCPLCGAAVEAFPLSILPERGMVVGGGHFVVIPPLEMALLARLVEVFPRILSKQSAMDWIYQLRPGDEPEMKIVDVLICKLRRKVAPLGIRIDTAWGRGYALATPAKPHVIEESVA